MAMSQKTLLALDGSLPQFRELRTLPNRIEERIFVYGRIRTVVPFDSLAQLPERCVALTTEAQYGRVDVERFRIARGSGLNFELSGGPA